MTELVESTVTAEEEPPSTTSESTPSEEGVEAVEAAEQAADPEGEEEQDAEAGDGDEEAPEGGRKRRLGPGAHLEDEELIGELSALLFASPDPLSLGRLQDLLRRPPKDRVQEGLVLFQERIESAGLPFVLREVAGGWRLFTAPHQHETVQRLSKAKKTERITPAALETLAIVAYRQPVTKAEIEAIRGVQAGPVLRSLVDRGLVKVAGRADQPGSPLQYGTSKDFLDRFGLASLKDLPRDAELVRD